VGEGVPLTTMRRMRAPVALSGLLLGPAAAYAHAHLERASPPADSTVRSPPGEVTLWLSQKLEAALGLVVIAIVGALGTLPPALH
jgi:methionine-rich copper-binding protein CopC